MERMEEEGATERDWEVREQQEQQIVWNAASVAPYHKWKVFVKGTADDACTLQGKGVCDAAENEENASLTSSQDGDATRSFYESVVRQGDSSEHMNTDTNWTESNTDTHQHTESVVVSSSCECVVRQADGVTDTYKQMTSRKDRNRKRHSNRHGVTQTDTLHREADVIKLGNTDSNPGSLKAKHINTFAHRKTDVNKPRDREMDPNTAAHSQASTSTARDKNTDQYSSSAAIQTLPFKQQDIHTALRLAQTNQTNALSTLLDQGLNVNTKDDFGWSLLMVAACAGALDTVRMLISHGARLGYRDARGNTALYLATINGHRKVTEALIKAGKRRPQGVENKEELKDDDLSHREISEDEEYFCESCEVNVKEKDRGAHKTSIVHQFKTKTHTTATRYGIPPSNRGYQLLVGQGWDTEGGLGSEKQGQKFPIKTVLKRDRKGFGADDGERTPRVTHFGPGDAKAVKRKQNTRVERPATVSRREMKEKKTRDQKEEIRLRRMLNGLDY